MKAQGTLELLSVSWQAIEDCYDIAADLPGWDVVLHSVDLSHPDDAASTILVNLLSSAAEQIGRFNPWYKAPAEAFGLHFSSGWRLTPEAHENWRPLLQALARAIAREPELKELQATLDATEWLSKPLVPASCSCVPQPDTVYVPPHMLLDATLQCEICGKPLRRITQPAS